MALADRRPHKFPVNSTLSSPSFNPKTLDSTGTIYNNDVMNDELIIDEELGNLDVNDSHDDEFDQNIDGKNLQNTRLRTTLNKSNSKFLDNMDIDIDGEGVEQDHDEDINEDGELQEELDNDSINSLSPMDNLSPTSRSISPDSLMNSDQKLTSNSSRSSTPNGSGSGSGSIYKQSFNPSAQISHQSSQISNDLPPSGISSASQGSQTSQSASQGSQSLAGQNSNSGTTVKKPKNTSRVPIATGISTTIPVTGEKPKPSQKDDASLEDDVLYAIFLILFEKDPEGKGMTVKQICDILIDRHPEMANLSTKTSNLVSAKLNAYVKRVEKGDSSLKYALSRDWADASPKRMVYVYRGLLTDDFHIHVKNMMESQKQQEKKNQQFQNSLNNSNLKLNNSSANLNANLGGSMDDDSFEAGKQASLKPRRQTMFDLGINRNSFLSSSIEKSNLFVPYNSAPVTASLKDKYLKKPELQKTESQDQQQPKEDQARDDQDQDNDHEDQDDDENDKKSILDDFEVFNDNDNDKEDSYYIETLKKNGKRSKSMSYLTNKKHKILTAAAAAPRAPKTPCSHSPNAAAAAAALHAAALKAINNYDITKNDLIKSHHNIKWLNVIRSGFLSTDIGTPEDISVSDLDKYF